MKYFSGYFHTDIHTFYTYMERTLIEHITPDSKILSSYSISGQGASSSSSASPPGSSSVGPANSPSRTVYREAGQNASLACGGVNANTLVRRLEWLCRGCRSSSPSHETTIAAFKGGRFVWF